MKMRETIKRIAGRRVSERPVDDEIPQDCLNPKHFIMESSGWDINVDDLNSDSHFVRFGGLMPSWAITMERTLFTKCGDAVKFEAGPQGWTIIYSDMSTEFRDAEISPIANMKAAMDVFVKKNPEESMNPVIREVMEMVEVDMDFFKRVPNDDENVCEAVDCERARTLDDEYECSGKVIDGIIGCDPRSLGGYVLSIKKDDVEFVKTYFPKSGGKVVFEVGQKGWHVTAPGRSMCDTTHQDTEDNFREAVMSYLKYYPSEDTPEFPLKYVFNGKACDTVDDIIAEAHQECGDLYCMSDGPTKTIGLVSPFDSCERKVCTTSENPETEHKEDVTCKEMTDMKESVDRLAAPSRFDVPLCFYRVPSEKRAYAAIANMTDNCTKVDGFLYDSESLTHALDRFGDDIRNGIVFGEFLEGDKYRTHELTLDMSKVTHRIVRAFWNELSLIVVIEFIRTEDNTEVIDGIMRRIGNPETEEPLYLSMRLDGKRTEDGIVSKRIVAVDIIEKKVIANSELLTGDIVEINEDGTVNACCEVPEK